LPMKAYWWSLREKAFALHWSPFVQHVFHPVPALKSTIQATRQNRPIRFECLDEAALARTVVADEHCQRCQFDCPAVLHGFEVLHGDRLQEESVVHRMSPLSTSR